MSYKIRKECSDIRARCQMMSSAWETTRVCRRGVPRERKHVHAMWRSVWVSGQLGVGTHICIIKFDNSNFHDHIRILLLKTNLMIYICVKCSLWETMSSAWETTTTGISSEAAGHMCTLENHVDVRWLFGWFVTLTQHGEPAPGIRAGWDSWGPHVPGSFVIAVLVVIFVFYSLRQFQWYIYVI